MTEKSKVFQAGDFEVKVSDLKCLTFEDIELFTNMEENKTESIKGIVSKTLKQAYPKITDEQIKKLTLKDTLALSKEIMKINGFKDLKKE